MFGLHLSWLGILLATLAYIVIGMFWYSPKIFGELWARNLGLKKKDFQHSTQLIGIEFLLGLFTAFVLALFVHWTASFSSWEGAVIGFWAALGFVATAFYSQVLWSKRPVQNFLIEAGCSLVSLTIMGAIIGMLTD